MRLHAARPPPPELSPNRNTAVTGAVQYMVDGSGLRPHHHFR